MKEYSCYIGGVKAGTKLLEVRNPYTGELTGTVATVDRSAVDQAIETALAFKATPTRHERYQILDRTRTMLDARRGEISKLMTAESGLCIRETTYEVGRAIDVLVLASHEALRDDGQVFSCDIRRCTMYRFKDRNMVADICRRCKTKPSNQTCTKITYYISLQIG